MEHFEFHLAISQEEMLSYYRGAAPDVLARCSTGVIIQFPASLLKPFVTSLGVHGDFVLTCGANRKGAQLRRL